MGWDREPFPEKVGQEGLRSLPDSLEEEAGRKGGTAWGLEGEAGPQEERIRQDPVAGWSLQPFC